MQATVFVLLVWLLNFGISIWNAYAVGKAWVETKHAGGWPRIVCWAGAVMSASGFSWCYLIILTYAAYALEFLDAGHISVAMNLGYILLITFTVRLTWFESGPGGWQNLVLPAICLALPAVGRLSMVVRSSMIDELNTQYVKVAKAKGLSRRRILGVHALKNAGIPYVTLLGWEIIRAVAGYTVVVETVFNWPGIGFMATTAGGENPVGSTSYNTLFAVGLTLFVITFAINMLSIALVRRYRQEY